MKPGATTRPSASIVRSAAAPAYLPTPTILPFCTATSAANAGSPEPSTTRPFVISRSYAILLPPRCPPLRPSAAACRGGPPSQSRHPPAPLRAVPRDGTPRAQARQHILLERRSGMQLEMVSLCPVTPCGLGDGK